MEKLNATAASLLGFLLEAPLTGWDLVQKVDESVGYFWNVTRSQVYRELRALAEEGFTKEQAPGKRDRVLYEITPVGRAAFKEWLAEEPGSDLLRLPIVLRVFFGDHLEPSQLRHHVLKARVEHQTRLTQYEKIRAHKELAAEPFVQQTIDLGIAYERTFLAWLDQLPIKEGAARGSATRRPAAKKRAKR